MLGMFLNITTGKESLKFTRKVQSAGREVQSVKVVNISRHFGVSAVPTKGPMEWRRMKGTRLLPSRPECYKTLIYSLMRCTYIDVLELYLTYSRLHHYVVSQEQNCAVTCDEASYPPHVSENWNRGKDLTMMCHQYNHNKTWMEDLATDSNFLHFLQHASDLWSQCNVQRRLWRILQDLIVPYEAARQNMAEYCESF